MDFTISSIGSKLFWFPPVALADGAAAAAAATARGGGGGGGLLRAHLGGLAHQLPIAARLLICLAASAVCTFVLPVIAASLAARILPARDAGRSSGGSVSGSRRSSSSGSVQDHDDGMTGRQRRRMRRRHLQRPWHGEARQWHEELYDDEGADAPDGLQLTVGEAAFLMAVCRAIQGARGLVKLVSLSW
jgi:hypothetical protein